MLDTDEFEQKIAIRLLFEITEIETRTEILAITAKRNQCNPIRCGNVQNINQRFNKGGAERIRSSRPRQ